MNQIPCAPQIRHLLDQVSPEHVTPLLMGMGEAPHRLGGLANHRMLAGGFAVALDGVEYFSSSAIFCPNGSTRTQANGQTRHFHVALTPVLVAPGQESVFPLSPVFVTPQDGHRKQDCEQAASGRWLQQGALRIAPAPWGATFLGDDLYCHRPFCEEVRAPGCHFLCVCLPQSNATLDERLSDEIVLEKDSRQTGPSRKRDDV